MNLKIISYLFSAIVHQICQIENTLYQKCSKNYLVKRDHNQKKTFLLHAYFYIFISQIFEIITFLATRGK